jgi:ribosomal protein S18 acetylase RimI-like enzyme
MKFNIRQATVNDAHAICQLLAEGGKLHAQALPTLLKSPDISKPEKFVNDILQDEASHILVAEVNQQVVGYIQFNHREEKEHVVVVPRSYVSVSSLIVKEEYQRQGIGKALMQRVHEWAEEHNIDDIELNVYEFNTPAQGFYEKLGYQTISRRMKRSK